MPDSPALEVRGLVKRYGGRAVVDELDLVALPGRVTAVLGPNGAGKTTTIECCEGLRTPDEGQVRVLGLDPRTQARELRPRVGVMLQDGGLPTGIRAADMLDHVARMYADPRDVGELSERLGLGSFARTTVRRLSGGQRQRLALAAAVVGRPDVVFLDEPSAGMDPQARLAVWELVRELRAEGVAVLLTTHLMDEAEDLADHVVVVDQGRVVAEGSVADLLTSADDRTLHLQAPAGLALAPLRAALGDAFTVTEAAPGSYAVAGPVDPAAVAAVAARLAQDGVLVSRLSVGRSTLEDVFLDLTGRDLR
ncbi:ABC transporter ATP-binding protein [Cellulomonas fimi]|uniref:ABC transporter related protein n=1 Tax=Cellulomonas fimi (strain ATCC 484 / DSM 20113 / JCM 1341 / CCUG 24087 / LMG 16345 / NBRC 15513 / NCIMB 8980 / NCTC 7547 / NRS-133) TaxID=590998 RepID=F4H8E2_CELFA|nr:ABC transporter ATP-binding protein [Cellulomonas fimi]AEE45823.1 ABC transporter related protein [Cellulomonas fimi ATCC 484]NNH07808.1 ABC transporter ATP-binding protein [Cellulomonas fimi]VEH30703.1 Daunorubicin/doxorubicin resistance ATP-binding protein DrrA [Cellulomonas fimi]